MAQNPPLPATFIPNADVQSFIDALPRNAVSDKPIRPVDVGGYHSGGVRRLPAQVRSAGGQSPRHDRVPSGGPKHLDDGPPQYSALRAIDPVNGAVRWEHRFRGYPSEMVLDLSGGAMTTASGLVFTGDNDGYLYAFDSATANELWRFQTGAPVWGVAPITYMLDGA